MRIESDFRFRGPRERVWEILLDPEVLAHVLPGDAALERVSADEYRGSLALAAGPLRAGRFDVRVRLRDAHPPRACTLEVEGEGGMGFARGSGRFDLSEPRAGVTLMRYAAELEVGGRIARAGRFLLESAARALARQGLAALDRELRARIAAGEGP